MAYFEVKIFYDAYLFEKRHPFFISQGGFIGRPKKSGFVDGLCITFIPDLAELVPEHGPK